MSIGYNSTAASGAISILEEIERRVRRHLDGVGLCYFLTSRAKSDDSRLKKLASKRELYSTNGKRMQDYFGVRVVTYYPDDIEVAHRCVSKAFVQDGTTIDQRDENSFGPQRYNVVFRLPDSDAEFFRQPGFELVDTTVEVQFRTVFSEGWHEVEHDRRYKRSRDWEGAGELRRTFNGLAATLETCDTMLLKVLHDLAYLHYKAGNWEAVVSHKFRLRLATDELSAPIVDLLNGDPVLAKSLFRADRAAFLKRLVRHTPSPLPLNANNLVFLVNRLQLKSKTLAAIEPPMVRRLLDQHKAAGKKTRKAPSTGQ